MPSIIALLRLFEYVMYLTLASILCAGCLRGEGNGCTEICAAAAALCMLLQSQ